jgi:hypothetical protein
MDPKNPAPLKQRPTKNPMENQPVDLLEYIGKAFFAALIFAVYMHTMPM